MIKFSDLGISHVSSFSGRKILKDDIIGIQIEVKGYVIEPSIFKYKDGTPKERVKMDLVINDEPRVFFSSSSVLIGQIKQVPKEKFSISTIIVEKGKSLYFT